MRNHMSAGMREKAVFVVAREMVGRQGMYSRPASVTAGEAERRAYRLLTLAGFTIVLFTSDALAAGKNQGQDTRLVETRMSSHMTPWLLSACCGRTWTTARA